MTELLQQARADALETLAERIDGDVYRPGDEGWDDARTAWNLAVDQRPAAVVVAESAADVAETVRAARAEGLRVAPQGTGHAASALGDLSDTILLRTTRLREVDVDPRHRRARVEAGVVWRRHQLARPQARARREHDSRRRDRRRRRTASARRRGARSGALLGDPRRRRELRDRHCPRAPALPRDGRRRGRSLLPGRAGRRGALD